jgi:hypothetical protein
MSTEKARDSISQSNTGAVSGGMQAAIGDNNRQVMQTHSSSLVLNQDDVLKLLVEIREILETSSISSDLKKKAGSRLEAAIDEVKEKEPDKQLVGGNLKRVAEVLEDASKTIDSGKGFLDKVKPIFQGLLVWLNVAKGFFGFC